MPSKNFYKRLFVGLSLNTSGPPKWKKYDIDLVKTDLMNNFMTPRGARLKMPNYGTIVWDLLFEPFTPTIRDLVIDDIKRVIANDPRVELIKLDVDESDHGITSTVLLNYKPFSVQDTLFLDFSRRVAERNRGI